MNHTMTRLAFMSPERKLGVALALVAGMMGVGCASIHESSTASPQSQGNDLVVKLSVDEHFFLNNSDLTVYKFDLSSKHKVLFRFSTIINGTERGLASWAVNPATTPSPRIWIDLPHPWAKNREVNEGRLGIMAGCLSVGDIERMDLAGPFLIPATLHGAGSTYSTDSFEIDGRTVIWQAGYVPENTPPERTWSRWTWGELLNTSKEQETQIFTLTAELAPSNPSPLQGSKTK